MPPETAHLPALDGLRGVAILMVMWVHFTPQWTTAHAGGWARLGCNLLNGGWAGVDLFFVLSGFLITGILIDAKRTTNSGPGRFFGHFYARRTLRIFPLYYAVLACVALMIHASGSMGDRQLWREFAPSMWFYASNITIARHGWLSPFHGLLLNHFWTLAVEEQFYLVWPMLVYLCAGRSLRAGCIASLVLAPILRYFWTAVDHNTYAAFVLMPCRIDSFAVGALVAMAVREVHIAGNRNSFRAAIPARRDWAWNPRTPLPHGRGSERKLQEPDHAACNGSQQAFGVRSEGQHLRLARAGMILMIVGALLLIPAFWNETLIDVLGRSVLALLSGGLILLALCGSPGSWFDNPVLRFLGKYSYGLYVLHFLIYPQLDRLFPLATCGVLLRFAGCVVTSCALAWCSWHLLEKQFLKAKRWFPMPQISEGTQAIAEARVDAGLMKPQAA